MCWRQGFKVSHKFRNARTSLPVGLSIANRDQSQHKRASDSSDDMDSFTPTVVKICSSSARNVDKKSVREDEAVGHFFVDEEVNVRHATSRQTIPKHACRNTPRRKPGPHRAKRNTRLHGQQIGFACGGKASR